MSKATITIEAEVSGPVEKLAVTKSLKKLASLKADDRNRIATILENPKALKGLKDNWNLLESMFS